MTEKIIECIPNFCEGQNSKTIELIADAIASVSGITLKCVDSGYYANRSVYTLYGNEVAIFEAAYRAIEKATEWIDMRMHKGMHPRLGAVDVFPFVALKGITNEELNPMVEEFAQKVSTDFSIPTYLYEKSAKQMHRQNLANVRKGEYEGLECKIQDKNWIPDFYPYYNAKTGAMVMGVRNILVAFNVNLATNDLNIAKQIAGDIRISGKWTIDEYGKKMKIQGLCEGVKAIGWFIKDFEKVQVSMNLVDLSKTSVYEAFETCKKLAESYNTLVTGSELIGCIPKSSLIHTGNCYHQGFGGLNENDLIVTAVNKLNLNDVKEFNFTKNVIDFL